MNQSVDPRHRMGAAITPRPAAPRQTISRLGYLGLIACCVAAGWLLPTYRWFAWGIAIGILVWAALFAMSWIAAHRPGERVEIGRPRSWRGKAFQAATTVCLIAGIVSVFVAGDWLGEDLQATLVGAAVGFLWPLVAMFSPVLWRSAIEDWKFRRQPFPTSHQFPFMKRSPRREGPGGVP